MTQISNGLSPSFPVENQGNLYKPESPPINEANSNRFEENFNKAMSEVSEGKETISPPDTGTVDKKRSSGSKEKVTVKKAVEENKPGGNKKGTLLQNGKKKNPKTVGGSDLSLLKNKKRSKIKNTEKGRVKKTVSNKTGERAVLDELAVKPDMENPDLPGIGTVGKISQNRDMESKNNDGETQNRPKIENETTIIPFPQAGNSGNQIKSSKKMNIGKVGAKTSKKGKEEQTLTVIDARNNRRGDIQKIDVEGKPSIQPDSPDQIQKESNQIVLGEQNTEKTGGEDVKSFQSRFAENREVLLARELKDSGNGQIVKKASFLLRDNNQGEIKLILKPESLGRVKIQLNMNENNLVGKIIVENIRVGQIFENNLSGLSKSFEEAGFNSTSIEVSVGDGQNKGTDQKKEFQNDQPFYSERLKTLDNAVPAIGRYGLGSGNQSIDLVV